MQRGVSEVEFSGVKFHCYYEAKPAKPGSGLQPPEDGIFYLTKIAFIPPAGDEVDLTEFCSLMGIDDLFEAAARNDYLTSGES